MAPIAIPGNISCTGYQNEFVLCSFVRSAYSKFVDISRENFYQNFSCTFVFSPFNEYTETAFK